MGSPEAWCRATVTGGAGAASAGAAPATAATSAMIVISLEEGRFVIESGGARTGLPPCSCGLRAAVEAPNEIHAIDLVGLKRLDRGRRVQREARRAVAVRLVGAHSCVEGSGDDLRRRGRIDVTARTTLVGRRGTGRAVLRGERGAR